MGLPMQFMPLSEDEKTAFANICIAIPKFNELSVILTDKPEAVEGMPKYGLWVNGPASEQASIYGWPVGHSYYFSQTDHEISSKSGVGVTRPDGSVETFRYHYIQKSNLSATLVAPHIKKLEILTSHGFRIIGPNGMPHVIIHDVDNAFHTDVHIRASGVTLEVVGVKSIAGELPNGVVKTVGKDVHNTVRAEVTDKRLWMVEGSQRFNFKRKDKILASSL